MESLHIKSKVKEQRNHNDWDNESEEYNLSLNGVIEKYPMALPHGRRQCRLLLEGQKWQLSCIADLRNEAEMIFSLLWGECLLGIQKKLESPQTSVRQASHPNFLSINFSYC